MCNFVLVRQCLAFLHAPLCTVTMLSHSHYALAQSLCTVTMLSVVITLWHNKQFQAQKQAVIVAAMLQQSVQSPTACQIGGMMQLDQTLQTDSVVKESGLPGIDTQQRLADQHLHQVSAVTACSLTLVTHGYQRREESKVHMLFPRHAWQPCMV